MIKTEKELLEALNAGKIKINAGGHFIYDNDYLSRNFSMGLFSREFNEMKNSISDTAYVNPNGRKLPGELEGGAINSDPMECGCCGARFWLSLSADDTEMQLYDLRKQGLSVCPAPNAMKEEFYVELDCPSGEFIIFNDLRRDANDNDVFNDESFNINLLAGIKLYTESFAKQGLGLIFVGNSSPSVVQESRTKLIIGCFGEDEPDNVIGSICTDLWWYSIIDRSLFEEKFKMTSDEYQKAYRKRGAWPKLVRAKVEPGTYRISSRQHLTSYEDDVEIFSVVELKK